MSGGFTLGGIANLTDIGTQTGSSTGTSITGSGSANTKSSYTQLIASTAQDAVGIWIFCSELGVSVQCTIDLAIGGAGSEQIIASNLQFSISTRLSGDMFIPLKIPAGSRVAARMQSASASDSCKVAIQLADGTFEGQSYSVWDDYGYSSSTSLGTQIDPGASANIKGSYAQIVASTTRDHFALCFMLDMNGSNPNSSDILLDLAIGGSGSEQVIIPNWQVKTSGGGASITITPQFNGPFNIQVPAGTRIAARAQSSDNTAASRKFGLVVYGLA